MGSAFFTDIDNTNDGLPVLLWEYINSNPNMRKVTLRVSGSGTVGYNGKLYRNGETFELYHAVASKIAVTPEAGNYIQSIKVDGKYITVPVNYVITVTATTDIELEIEFKEVGSVASAGEFYVSPEGDDVTGDGSLAKPFATISRAQIMIRMLKESGQLSDGEFTVYLRGGDYVLTESLTFDENDSGTDKTTIVYKAYEGETPRIVGGIKIPASQISKVTDSDVLNRVIDPFTRTKLMKIDLNGYVDRLEQTADYGTGVDNSVMLKGIYVDGTVLSPSRWPNSDFLRIGDRIVNGATFKFDYIDETNHAKTYWSEETLKELWIKGYIGWDWAGVAHKVANVDFEAKELSSAGKTGYPVRAGQRFFFMNLLEEIDVPGESFTDRENKVIYFYPRGDVKDAEVFVTTLKKPVISMNGVQNLRFEGITMSYSEGNVLDVQNCSDIIFDGCEISHCSGRAASLVGNGLVIRNSHIYDMGAGGITVTGGDRVKLISSENLIENNRIHSVSRDYTTYMAAVGMDGVGITVRSNEMYDAPHLLMQISGNDHVIEQNEIYNAVRECSDMGAIYWGRDVSVLGLQINDNYFHDIGNSYGGHGQQAVFWDDGCTGPVMSGNVFYRATTQEDNGKSYAIKTHAGQYSKVSNNLFIEAPRAAWFQTWNGDHEIQTDWYSWVLDKPINSTRSVHNIYAKLQAVDFDSGIWEEHYKGTIWTPVFDLFGTEKYNQIKDKDVKNADDLKFVTNFANANAPKDTNEMSNNVFVKILNSYVGDAVSSNNYSMPDSVAAKAFENYGEDFTLTNYGITAILSRIPGFENIAFSNMGLKSAVGGVEPSVSEQMIIGDLSIGNAATVKYAFVDSDGDKEGATRYKWYIADSENGARTLIADKEDSELLITADYKGKYLFCEITPYDINGLYGETVMTGGVKVGTNNSIAEKLEEAIAEAEKILTEIEAGEGFGQAPEEELKMLGELVESGKNADSEAEDLYDIYAAIMLQVEEVKATTVQDTESIRDGNYDVYGFMDDMVINLSEGQKTSLNLPCGEVLPGIVVNGFVTVDGVKQNAVLTIPSGVVIEGEGKIELSLFGEGAPSVTVDGEDITALKFTASKVKADKEITISIENASPKKSAYADNGTAKMFTSSTGTEYSRKTERKTLIIGTRALGEIILYDASKVSDDEEDNGETPVVPSTPSAGGGGGGGSSSSSGNKVTYDANAKYNKPENSEPSVTPEAPEKEFVFDDVVGHWAEKDVMAMYKAGIVTGVTETTFEPDRNITRAEFATLVVKALKLENGEADFEDVGDEWFAPFVGAAAKAGIIVGSDGMFRPNDTITRQEMAVIVVKAYEYLEKTADAAELTFADKADIADWATDFVAKAVGAGLISGMGDNMFAPSDNATRAQSASIISRILKRIPGRWTLLPGVCKNLY